MPRWLLSLPLLITACAGGPEYETEAAQAALASHRASLEALGAPAPAPSARPPAEAPSAAAGPVNPPGATNAQITAPWHASALLGASPEAVRAALGEPVLRREEGPAEVWLYTGGGCQLDIVLYPGEAGQRVAHVQARAGGLAQRTEASCLRDLASQGGSRNLQPRMRPHRDGPSSLGPSPLGQPLEIEV